MRKIARIIVHHGANPVSQTTAQVRAYHKASPPNGRGWKDIGYHFYIYQLSEGPWTVEAGRPVSEVGAHDDGQNADSIGVCIAGNYVGSLPTEPAWDVLVATLVCLCKKFGLRAQDIEGHRENEPSTTPTACPGFDPALLRKAVSEKIPVA